MERDINWLNLLIGRLYCECISLREDLNTANQQIVKLTTGVPAKAPKAKDGVTKE